MHEPCKMPSSPDQPKLTEGTELRRPYVPPQLVDYGSVANLTQGIHTRLHDHFGGRSLGPSGT
jgi:hypothetical protein